MSNHPSRWAYRALVVQLREVSKGYPYVDHAAAREAIQRAYGPRPYSWWGFNDEGVLVIAWGDL